VGYRLGIDVGGTFTDLALLDEASGTFSIGKVPSVTADPSQGILDGITRLLSRCGVAPEAVTYLAHGTTVATNTLLQRRGARTGLITTRGFRDLLEIARQRRPSLYDLHVGKPEPLVPRSRRVEVTERVMADGTPLVPLDQDETDLVLERIAREGVEALAICFLHAYLNPAHEQAVLERARRRLPGVFVSASHQVLPEFREYERLSTTVTNAYLGPAIEAYVRSFRRRVHELGISATPYVNQSNGGTIGIDEAARAPVKTVLSGPSAGVAGAAWLARRTGIASVVTFDMGGTSTDVSFVRHGVPTLAFEREIGGIPLRLPALDIHTIGAGGGSIAWRDSGGALLVGPQSAGADPGPACYGRGGADPTVTDANLLLGGLSAKGLLGGQMPLDVGKAERALAELGKALGLSAIETARGIVRVVNANMVRALRVVTVERGIDPAELALLPFGGAGPLHAGALARELGLRTILVPPHPGILCALGLLVGDLRSDAVRTLVAPLDAEALVTADRIFRELEAEAGSWLDRERIPPGRRRVARWLDLRYEGQNYELSIPADEDPGPNRGLEGLARRFRQAHEETYGFAPEDEPIQVVTVRLVARGLPDLPDLPAHTPGDPDPSAALGEWREVDFADAHGTLRCPVYARAALRAGHRLRGPAVVEQFDSTVLLHAGQEGVVNELGLLVITEG